MTGDPIRGAVRDRVGDISSEPSFIVSKSDAEELNRWPISRMITARDGDIWNVEYSQNQLTDFCG